MVNSGSVGYGMDVAASYRTARSGTVMFASVRFGKDAALWYGDVKFGIVR